VNLRVPLFDWLSHYQSAWLRPDILAGLTTAAVVIPKAMAYATVAGLPIELGIYTAIIPALVYAVLGTSRVLSVTTTTTIAILVGAQLAAVVPDGDPAKLLQALATLALMVGAVLTLASVLRLGFFADFVSYPVQVGFKAGIGFVIIADQAPKLFGFKIHKEGFFRDVWSLIESLPSDGPIVRSSTTPAITCHPRCARRTVATTLACRRAWHLRCRGGSRGARRC